MAQLGQAEARWRDPGGSEQSGVLTTATAPDITGAAAGARIPIWLDRSGQPVAPPVGQLAMIVNLKKLTLELGGKSPRENLAGDRA